MRKLRYLAALVVATLLLFPPQVSPHCDTLAGPVVADAKAALQSRSISPVLKWIKPEYESEVRTAFAQTLKVRAQGSDARELSDNYFFETVVRLHRAGEGAPFTGLKPAEAVEPIIQQTDRALASGNADTLLQAMQNDVQRGLQARFLRAQEAAKHQHESLAAGREYVEAYVELTHYVEALHAAAGGAQVPSHVAVHGE